MNVIKKITFALIGHKSTETETKTHLTVSPELTTPVVPETIQNAVRDEQSLIEEKTKAWQAHHIADNHLKASGVRPKGDFIPIFQRIASFIPKGSKILDVGCGHGRLALPLAELGNDVTATDVSERMLELLKENIGKLPIKIKLADAHRLPAENAEYDVVVSSDFMPHFPDWPRLLAEKTRVCKKGGLIIFGFNFKEHKEYCKKIGIADYDHPYTPEVGGSKPFWAETTLDEMREMGSKHGLEIMEVVPLKFITDNFLLGGSLGVEEYSNRKKEANEFFKNSPAVEEYYSWLNFNVFQKLPYFTSYLSLVVFRKKN